jgi:hypothetical protein
VSTSGRHLIACRDRQNGYRNSTEPRTSATARGNYSRSGTEEQVLAVTTVPPGCFSISCRYWAVTIGPNVAVSQCSSALPSTMRHWSYQIDVYF